MTTTTQTQNLVDAAFANPAGGFISIINYRTSKGEVANYLVNGSVSYPAYNERKRTFLVAALDKVLDIKVGQVLECEACHVELVGKTLAKRFGTDEGMAVALLADIAESYQKAIARCDGDTEAWNDNAVHGAVAAAEEYEHLAPGLKRHSDGALHVSGLLVKKVVVDDSEKVATTHRADTVVKAWIKRIAEEGLDLPAWVQFRLTDNFTRLAMAGTVIEPVADTQSEAL